MLYVLIVCGVFLHALLSATSAQAQKLEQITLLLERQNSHPKAGADRRGSEEGRGSHAGRQRVDFRR